MVIPLITICKASIALPSNSCD